jgi:hypothetical protein
MRKTSRPERSGLEVSFSSACLLQGVTEFSFYLFLITRETTKLLQALRKGSRHRPNRAWPKSE